MLLIIILFFFKYFVVTFFILNFTSENYSLYLLQKE